MALGTDPVLTASALSAMLEHFCYIWLGQGGERTEVQFDDERAIDTLAHDLREVGLLAAGLRR